MRVPRLLIAILWIGGFYILLKIPSGRYLIPSSVILIYMFFVITGVLLIMTFNEESAQEMAAPILSLLGDRDKRLLRNIAFVIIPLFFGYLAYTRVRPSFEPPVELRAVHPAPPSSVKIYDRSYNLLTLENPLRKDSASLAQYVKEGGEIYFKNCFYCHGDKLDGKGHNATGFNPLPANFQDVGTIAQLQESYVFWRVTTGGPGLPNEATPWLSAMPVWQHFLSEDDIWKVIMFIYDYTGHVPRVMKEEANVNPPPLNPLPRGEGKQIPPPLMGGVRGRVRRGRVIKRDFRMKMCLPVQRPYMLKGAPGVMAGKGQEMARQRNS